MENSSSNESMTSSERPTEVNLADITSPSQLKFLMSNLRSMISTLLTIENYLLWRSQINKLFNVNGLEGYLDGSARKPCKEISDDSCNIRANSSYNLWLLIDQNLATTLYSTIPPQLLPYVLNLDTCSKIWKTIEKRLQSTNKSRILQLKNKLYHITMGEKNMMQFLSDIKSKFDAIAALGAHKIVEDIILYTLNGLPSSYQAFKTFIRTTLQPIGLDDFYALSCSEKVNLQLKTRRNGTIPLEWNNSLN